MEHFEVGGGGKRLQPRERLRGRELNVFLPIMSKNIFYRILALPFYYSYSL
jgi:hypothetical protein